MKKSIEDMMELQTSELLRLNLVLSKTLDMIDDLQVEQERSLRRSMKLQNRVIDLEDNKRWNFTSQDTKYSDGDRGPM